MTCSTCHDPHEVTQNDWKERVTVPGLKKQCQDCHLDQAAIFAKNEIHGSNKCSSCHMPTMMSCENFAAIQFTDFGGFDAQRTSHIWKIRVDPEAKTLNPPPGKDRSFRGGGWRLAREGGKPFVDLMWSCGRTTWGDDDLEAAGGCHSPVQSILPDKLHFRNQRQIFDVVSGWQKPVRDGVADARGVLERAKVAIAAAKLPKARLAQAQHLANDADDLLAMVERDGSWGVHAPSFTLGKVRQAKLLAEGAIAHAGGTPAKDARKVSVR